MAFARFMSTTTGRLLRIVAGIALILIGLLAVGDGGGVVLAIIGVIPLLAGVFNVCLVGPLLGAPFYGKDIKQ